MKRIFILLSLLVSLVATGSAAPTFTLQAPERVREGQQFAVTYRFANGGDVSALNVPPIEGCKLLFGPARSTRQSYQVINGQATSSSSIDFTYTYRAGSPGTYTIPEASIQSDGRKLTTQAATLTVVADPSAGAQGSAGAPPVSIDDISTQSASRDVDSRDVMVRIILSRSKVYEQEAIECTIKLYTKFNISSFRPTLQPSFDGFLIDDVDVRPALNEVESYGGQNYYTAVLKRCVIFPQKSGTLTINSGNYDITVVQYESVNMGLFSMRNPVERDIRISSNTASVDVMPLPSPQPEGFTGAVGHFNIDSRLVGNSFRTNDPATLIYTITGTGNIKYVKEPAIDFPSEFEQYNPQSNIDTRISGTTVSGSMTVEYTFVPTTVGDFKIGADKFVYFDPTKKEYVTLTTSPYDIHVVKGLTPSSETVDRKDIEVKNTDILHIRRVDNNLSMTHTPVAEKTWYWLLYAGVVVMLVAAVVIYGKAARARADVAGRRTARAGKTARKRLQTAASLLKRGESDRYYEELLRALWGYLGDKLSMSPSQLSRDNVTATLSSRYGEAGSRAATEFIDVIDRCEMARYTPSASQGADKELYDLAAETISTIDRLKN